MNDVCTYLIRLRGNIDEAEVNSLSPLQVAAATEAGATVLTVRADQAGLIGLMRHLHGLGLVFQAVNRVDQDTPERSVARGVDPASR